MPAYCAPPPGNMNTTDGGSRVLLAGGDRALRIALLERAGDRRRRVAATTRAAVRERLAPDQQGVGDVGEVSVGLARRCCGQRRRRASSAAGVARRQR